MDPQPNSQNLPNFISKCPNKCKHNQEQSDLQCCGAGPFLKAPAPAQYKVPVPVGF